MLNALLLIGTLMRTLKVLFSCIANFKNSFFLVYTLDFVTYIFILDSCYAKKMSEKEEEKKQEDDVNSLFGDSEDEDEKVEPVTQINTEIEVVGQDIEADNADSDTERPKKKKKLKRRKRSQDKGSDDDDDEKRSFIDSDEDIPDIKKTYDVQNEYEDEDDPFNDDKDGENVPLLNQAEIDDDNEIDNILKRLKGRNKKKGDGMTEEQREFFVHGLLVKMDKAYNDDLNCRRNNKPCLNKIKLLNSVIEALQKSSLQQFFLEKNILEVLENWLRPSPVDGSLPDLTIRNKIYDLLFKLPIESDQLRRANFGKLIAYLRDSKKETSENRAKLRTLVQNWARMIFGKTDNFKMLEQLHSHRNSRTFKASPEKAKTGSARRSKSNRESDIGELSGLNKLKQKNSKGKKQVRAQIPQPRDFQFKRRVVDGTTLQNSKVKGPVKHDRLNRQLKKKRRKKGR